MCDRDGRGSFLQGYKKYCGAKPEAPEHSGTTRNAGK